KREEDGVKILKTKNNTPLFSQGGTMLEEPTNNINEESDLEEETAVVREIEENIGNIKKINISEVTKNQGLESSELIGILNKIDECKQDSNDMGNIHKSIFRI
ncbi:hypothetical protein CWI36_2500p0010, partial [Hamiltosporidium magnivora]